MAVTKKSKRETVANKDPLSTRKKPMKPTKVKIAAKHNKSIRTRASAKMAAKKSVRPSDSSIWEPTTDIDLMEPLNCLTLEGTRIKIRSPGAQSKYDEFLNRLQLKLRMCETCSFHVAEDSIGTTPKSSREMRSIKRSYSIQAKPLCTSTPEMNPSIIEILE